MAKAQVGDLIRITGSEDVPAGKIYEVINVDRSGDVYVDDTFGDGSPLWFYDDEYEIHRKAGDEDSIAEYPLEIGEPIGIGVKVDAVNPQHYKQGRTEVIDIIEDAVAGAEPFEAVCQANVLKYTLRYRHKNGVEDLKKAVWYAEKLIAHLMQK